MPDLAPPTDIFDQNVTDWLENDVRDELWLKRRHMQNLGYRFMSHTPATKERYNGFHSNLQQGAEGFWFGFAEVDGAIVLRVALYAGMPMNKNAPAAQAWPFRGATWAAWDVAPVSGKYRQMDVVNMVLSVLP